VSWRNWGQFSAAEHARPAGSPAARLGKSAGNRIARDQLNRPAKASRGQQATNTACKTLRTQSRLGDGASAAGKQTTESGPGRLLSIGRPYQRLFQCPRPAAETACAWYQFLRCKGSWPQAARRRFGLQTGEVQVELGRWSAAGAASSPADRVTFGAQTWRVSCLHLKLAIAPL